MRIVFAVRPYHLMLGLVGLVVATTACSNDQPRASMYLVASELPEDMAGNPLFGCVSGPDEAPTHVVTGYRGTEPLDLEVYDETPFLRIFVNSSDSPDTPSSVSEAAASLADPGTEFPTRISGHDAIGFEVSTAEPILTPWPGVAWEQNSVVVTVIGEGLDRQMLSAAANSVTAIPRDEYLALAPSDRC